MQVGPNDFRFQWIVSIKVHWKQIQIFGAVCSLLFECIGCTFCVLKGAIWILLLNLSESVFLNATAKIISPHFENIHSTLYSLVEKQTLWALMHLQITNNIQYTFYICNRRRLGWPRFWSFKAIFYANCNISSVFLFRPGVSKICLILSKKWMGFKENIVFCKLM